MQIAAAGRALPNHYYGQEELVAELMQLWRGRHWNVERLAEIHKNVLVGGRHLALPLAHYARLGGFTEANAAFVEHAVPLGVRAVESALARAELSARDVDHIFFATVTGVSTPSIDALLVEPLGLRADVKRTPLFGLGCVAGAAGLARAADYLRGHPDEVVVLLCVELCSLTLQREDLSVANIVASGLFGDGAAAVVLVGAHRRASGPVIRATRSVFYPNTREVMGWRIGERGFQVVLSAEVPKVVEAHLGADVDAFLADQGLVRSDIESVVCHPGGPRVLQAVERTLGLSGDALALSWRSLREVGNLSSASVLFILEDTLHERRPTPESNGLLLAMGPGFCAELLLLKW